MNKRAEQEKLKELHNFVFWKKFHNYGNKSIKVHHKNECRKKLFPFTI
jgi:hypothetical protein